VAQPASTPPSPPLGSRSCRVGTPTVRSVLTPTECTEPSRLAWEVVPSLRSRSLAHRRGRCPSSRSRLVEPLLSSLVDAPCARLRFDRTTVRRRPPGCAAVLRRPVKSRAGPAAPYPGSPSGPMRRRVVASSRADPRRGERNSSRQSSPRRTGALSPKTHYCVQIGSSVTALLCELGDRRQSPPPMDHR
jgi:hypothetical protein